MAPAMSESRAGMLSSASYALLMILVGVPVWWKTTEVYRVSLPYEEIENLTSDLRLKVDVQLVSIDARDEHLRGPELQKLLKDSDVYTFLLGSRSPTKEETRLLEESPSLEQLDIDLFRLHSNVLPGTIILFEIYDERGLMGDKTVVLGHHRCLFFTSRADASDIARVLREVVLGETAVQKMIEAVEAPHHKGQDAGVLRRVPASKGCDVLFSLLVPQPEKIMVSWDIGKAIDSYVEPFIRGLGNFSTISVKSQVLYLTKLNLKPREVDGVNLVNQKDLGLAINPVESQLASHVSSQPRLNFLAYVPTIDQSPLHIVAQEGERLVSNSFLIPRWGGVVIYNTPDSVEQLKKKKEEVAVEMNMERVMSIFISQFRLLLGLQDPATLLLQDTNVEVLPFQSGSRLIRVWERDYLYRLRTLENLVLTRVTLQSLAHLLTQISNIVINDAIGEEVRDAVDACHDAARHIEMGRLEEAFAESKRAFLSSEKAFFDPSLLALLYFPEDQKYAIYIPLFLPVGIPVIMSLKTIFVFVKTGVKPKAD